MLFSQSAFNGFGPNDLETEKRDLTTISADRPARLRASVRSECPRRPGVYGMLDQRGELIYVGKAKSLRSRLLSYFRTKSRDKKAGRIIRHTSSIVWEHSASEFSALLRELDLIQRWEPRFNVQAQPKRSKQIFLCLGRRPAPYLYLSSKVTRSAEAWYGPVSSSAMAREAVRHLNDLFQLRDCPRSQEMVFSDQQELFPVVRAPGCIRHDLGTCVAPCAALCSKQSYEECVNSARQFLEGLRPSLIVDLEEAMASASASLQFERAAAIRNRLEAIQWLHDRLERLRRLREQSFVYCVDGHEGEDRWFVIHRSQIRAVMPVPETSQEKQEARERVDSIFADEPGRVGDLIRERRDRALLIMAWFRRHSEEREKTMSPAKVTKLLTDPSE